MRPLSATSWSSYRVYRQVLMDRPRQWGRCTVSSLARSIKVSGTARKRGRERNGKRRFMEGCEEVGKRSRIREPKISRTETTLLLKRRGRAFASLQYLLEVKRDPFGFTVGLHACELPDTTQNTTRTTGGLVTSVLTRLPLSASPPDLLNERTMNGFIMRALLYDSYEHNCRNNVGWKRNVQRFYGLCFFVLKDDSKPG